MLDANFLCSDTTVGHWNAQLPDRVGGNLLHSFTHHTEFVCGLDWDIGAPGRLASCGWDRRVVCWTST
jgi:WD40 repeat protein